MSSKIRIAKINKDFAISDIENAAWENAGNTLIDRYWSGDSAPSGRHFKSRLLWSQTALYVRFEAKQSEPLIISKTPDLSKKTKGLWDRDVCEIFLAPNPTEFREYFEFEVAPTGEWIDLGIRQMPDKRETDWHFDSGMETAARIEEKRIWMAMKISWNAFGKIPVNGEIWKGNLLRCVGSGESRGYLAWQPTFTAEPSFHVPEKFGDFEFIK